MSNPVFALAARRIRSNGMAMGGLLLALLLTTCLAQPAWAQGFTTDARMVGQGGTDRSTIATSLTEDSKSYRSIGLPLGLIQLYQDRHDFDPGDKANFNPLRAIEDLSNPLHFTFGRDSESAGDKLVKDVINGNLSRNLLDYKGFMPKSPLSAQGAFMPNWGHTFPVVKSGRVYQGIFAGAGPYLTAGTSVTYDPLLLSAWSGATSSIPANSSLSVHDYTSGQAALQVTGGYRAKFESPKSFKTKYASDRDGVYVAVNYHYLRGYHYDSDTIDARFDTDSSGLIALAIPATSPVVLDRQWSKSGRGRAVDVGTSVVTGRWEFDFGANGIGNQIRWDNMQHEQNTLAVVIGGLDFVKSTLPPTASSVTVKLPVQYSAGSAYHARKWNARGQYARRLNGSEYHGGMEYHLGPIDVRGGGRYVKKFFNPTAGVGLNLGPHFGIDAAVFTNSANAQQDRRVSTALSLRFQ